MREKVSLISEVYLLDREKTAFIASANRSMFLDPLYPKIEVLESEESEELVEEVEQDILPTLEGGYFGSGITVLNYYPIDDSEYDDLDSEELYDQIREDFSSNIEL